MAFNENTRVKIPAILHLCRLGYEYLSLSGTKRHNETVRHLELLNLKESIENNVDTTNLLNIALENVLCMFRKISEQELIIADQLKDILRKTREALGSNFDQKDPEFVSLYDELKRLFDKKNLDEISQEETHLSSLRF